MVCLHGFGEYADRFDNLSPLMPDYTLVALDLPWHGKTDWQEGLSMPVAWLTEILDLIPEIRGKKFGLMGYSMGGRICLSLLTPLMQRITELVLIAPDGLTINPWYWLATQTYLGNRLFRLVMNNPAPFRGLLQLGQKTRLVNESILKFVQQYLDDRSMREQVYRVWTTLAHFSVPPRRLPQRFQQAQIPVAMIFGRYDRIIPPRLGFPFATGEQGKVHLSLLEAGHQLLHPRYLPLLAEAIQQGTETKSSPA